MLQRVCWYWTSGYLVCNLATSWTLNLITSLTASLMTLCVASKNRSTFKRGSALGSRLAGKPRTQDSIDAIARNITSNTKRDHTWSTASFI